jgi:circadian clock protein KaiB
MNKAPNKVRYRLRLYIAGRGPYATRAEQNLADAAAAAGFDYDLEVIDLCAEPHRALPDHVVVTPTMVKLSPLPRAIVIGDLSDRERILQALGFPG